MVEVRLDLAKTSLSIVLRLRGVEAPLRSGRSI